MSKCPIQGASINDALSRGSLKYVKHMGTWGEYSYGWSRGQGQKKCIRMAEKSCTSMEKLSGSFFSSREFFLFLDLDCLTSLRSVRQPSDLGKEKILSRKRKFAFEFFHLRATSFQPHGTYILLKSDLKFVRCFWIIRYLDIFWCLMG